jgi:hypothetical protein
MLLGLCVAFFSASLGIGGGAIFVSVFLTVFHFDYKRATSTSLAMIIPITFIGALTHLCFTAQTFSVWYFVFIPACVAGSLIGGRVVYQKDLTRLKYLLAVFLLILSLRMMRVIDLPSLMYAYIDQWIGQYALPFMVLFGFLTGVLSIVFGVGCGLVMVPFFIIVLNLSMHAAICLSLVTMFFLSMAGTLYHKKYRGLDPRTFKCMFLPVVAGAVMGALFANQLPGSLLKKIFSGLLFVFGVKIAIESFLQRKDHAH